jgi:hypothetical protein
VTFNTHTGIFRQVQARVVPGVAALWRPPYRSRGRCRPACEPAAALRRGAPWGLLPISRPPSGPFLRHYVAASRAEESRRKRPVSSTPFALDRPAVSRPKEGEEPRERPLARGYSPRRGLSVVATRRLAQLRGNRQLAEVSVLFQAQPSLHLGVRLYRLGGEPAAQRQHQPQAVVAV